VRLILLLLTCLSSLLLQPVAAAGKDARSILPSFDCAKATEEDEMAICSSRKLASLDVIIADGYAQLQHRLGNGKAKRIGAPLLTRRRACRAEMDCIYRRQLEIAKTLQTHGATIALPEWAAAGARSSGDKLPTAVGQCSQTTIDDIGSRLEGDPDFSSGTSVSFSNGGYQVTYDTEPAIISSRLGDPVTICLASLPENCPPGDERGKTYKTTNARTGQSWTLSDAEHMCGGA